MLRRTVTPVARRNTGQHVKFNQTGKRSVVKILTARGIPQTEVPCDSVFNLGGPDSL